jgi:hypothetical protein
MIRLLICVAWRIGQRPPRILFRSQLRSHDPNLATAVNLDEPPGPHNRLVAVGQEPTIQQLGDQAGADYSRA